MQDTNIVDKNSRISNFEILRILAIFMIIMHHFVLQTGAIYSTNLLTYYVAQFFYIGGKLGVDLFVIISGYFSVEKEFSIKRVIKLLAEVWFYTIGLTIICKIFITHDGITLKEMRRIILPITSNTYWFFTTYFFMYMVSPFLNKFIKLTSKQDLKNLITIAVVLILILPTFFNFTIFLVDI